MRSIYNVQKLVTDKSASHVCQINQCYLMSDIGLELQ